MGVDFYRDYASLERMPPGALEDRGVMLAWLHRRNLAISAAAARHDYLQAAWSGWDDVFTLAVLYGWSPQGTVHPDPDWGGGYFSNDGARVSGDDARNFAAALERALGDPNPPNAAAPKRIDSLYDPLPDARAGVEDALQRLRDSEQRGTLHRYVRFLRRGSFTIE